MREMLTIHKPNEIERMAGFKGKGELNPRRDLKWTKHQRMHAFDGADGRLPLPVQASYNIAFISCGLMDMSLSPVTLRYVLVT